MTTRNPMFSTLPLLFAVACTPGVDGPNDSDDPQTGRVEGRVQSDSRRDGVEGAVITAFHVESDGSLTQVSDGSVTTDAEGRYAIDVVLTEGASASGATDLVIRAESEGYGAGHVIVTDTVTIGNTVTAAPIDAETSAEAEAWIELRADGNWDGTRMNTAMLRAVIDAESGSQLDVISAPDAGEVDVFADAALAAMVAWTEVASAEDTAGTDADLATAMASMTEAMVAYDMAVDAARTGPEVADAEATLIEDFSAAWTDAGFTTADVALMAHAAAEASAIVVDDLSNTATADAWLVGQNALRAAFTAEAVWEASGDLGLTPSGASAIASASDELVMGIGGLTVGSGDVADSIDGEWQAFEASVSSAIEADLPLATWLAVDAAFAEADALAAALEVELQTMTEAGTQADAVAVETASLYEEFAASLESSATVDRLTNTALGETGADAMAEILVQTQAYVGG